MPTGWIKLHRKMTGWGWYEDIHTKTLFIHLLLIARSEDGESRGVPVMRGQVITGRRKLSVETGLSERQVRTALNRLKSTHELTIKTTSKHSIITLCNYGEYQGRHTKNDQVNDQQRDQQDVRQATTKQEVKKKEVKNKRINTDDFRPAFISVDLWKAVIDNRKFKKLQNTELALKTFSNSIKRGIEAGYTAEECIGEYVSSSWKRFSVDWMKGEPSEQSGNNLPERTWVGTAATNDTNNTNPD